MERKIKINGLYKHFKGKIVKVLMLGKDSSSLDDLVIYNHIDDEVIWVRNLQEFLSEVDHVKYPDVKQKYRFEEIEEEEK